MRVKAADIAKKLNLSRATVSLALNNKPGVSEQTKQEVLACRDRLMQGSQETLSASPSGGSSPASPSGGSSPASPAGGSSPASSAGAASPVPTVSQPGMIKVIMFDRGLTVICNEDLNLYPVSVRQLESEAKRLGFSISLSYMSTDPADIQAMINECNGPSIAGVILFATEMYQSDYRIVTSINKPLVVYDNDFSNLYHSVVADNDDITQQLVRHLVKKGYRTLHYLAQDFTIYNFEQRRIGYLAGIYTEHLVRSECPIIITSNTIEGVERFMTDWLQKNPLPDAFIMENYQISIATMHAMKKLGVKVPEQVGLVGIDDVSSYLTDGQKLSCVQIDHVNRIAIAVQTLVNEIQGGSSDIKLKIATRSKIVNGDTLRR